MSSRNILLCLGSTLPKRICRGCQVPTCRSSQVWGGGLGGESPPTPTKVHGRVKGVASSVCSPPGEREGCTEVGEWRWAMILAHRSGMQAGRMIQTRTSKHRGPLELLDGALRLWWDLVASPNKHRTHKLPDGVFLLRGGHHRLHMGMRPQVRNIRKPAGVDVPHHRSGSLQGQARPGGLLEYPVTGPSGFRVEGQYKQSSVFGLSPG